VINRLATCADGRILGDFNLNLLEKPGNYLVSFDQAIDFSISLYDQ
jgi:hypothetical protein